MPDTRALIMALPNPVIIVGSDNRIRAINAPATRLVGKDCDGWHYITALRQPALLDVVEATLQDGKARTTRYLGNDGAQDTTFSVSVRAVPGLGRDGSGLALLVFEDITHVEQTNQMRRSLS